MKRSNIILISFILLLTVMWLYLSRPIEIAETHSPHEWGGKIRIVEIPSSGLGSLLIRDNPKYRFEYISRDGFKWSSATFAGESYRAKSGEITWMNSLKAVCSLDEYPIFVFTDRHFQPYSTYKKTESLTSRGDQ